MGLKLVTGLSITVAEPLRLLNSKDLRGTATVLVTMKYKVDRSNTHVVSPLHYNEHKQHCISKSILSLFYRYANYT